jgi:hypothetical protein
MTLPFQNHSALVILSTVQTEVAFGNEGQIGKQTPVNPLIPIRKTVGFPGDRSIFVVIVIVIHLVATPF